jgi:hypothetical protein
MYSEIIPEYREYDFSMLRKQGIDSSQNQREYKNDNFGHVEFLPALQVSLQSRFYPLYRGNLPCTFYLFLLHRKHQAGEKMKTINETLVT